MRVEKKRTKGVANDLPWTYLLIRTYLPLLTLEFHSSSPTFFELHLPPRHSLEAASVGRVAPDPDLARAERASSSEADETADER